jgi:hypothetical protein
MTTLKFGRASKFTPVGVVPGAATILIVGVVVKFDPGLTTFTLSILPLVSHSYVRTAPLFGSISMISEPQL